MKSFDKVIRALQDSAVSPWDEMLKKAICSGEIMMCIRWHYDSSVIVRIAVHNTIGSVVGAIACPPPPGSRCDVECAPLVVHVLKQMASACEEVKGTDMEDVARAASDLLAPGTMHDTLVEDLLFLSVRSDAMNVAVRTCVCGAACRFANCNVAISTSFPG